MDSDVGSVLRDFAGRLDALGVVTALWVGGSMATGDYVPGVSDLDLVAVTAAPLAPEALARVTRLHREVDRGLARGMDLGCQYPDAARLHDVAAPHPTWTHGGLVERVVSPVTRAELVLHGVPVLGRPPPDLLPPVTPDDIRAAARFELAGYWSSVARRPQVFVRLPVLVDLGLTSMARGRHAVVTGRLLTKSAAVEQIQAPAWLRDQVRDRRRGGDTTSPRWRGAHAAWRDVLRTTSRYC